MYNFAILLGIYSYFIFFLGVFNLLTKENVVYSTLLFLVFSLFLIKKNINTLKFSFPKNLTGVSALVLLAILFFINLIGAFGPELAFDALWYHLTLPKIFLENSSISHIPGGLFYYSDMPKLIEMLYVVVISLSNEIGAKLIHYSFGILISFVIYKLSRLYLSRTISLLAVLIFYSNLVVDWLSITAYIDLGRTFFEALSLYMFALFYKTKKNSYLYKAAIMLGFAISAKLLAVGTLFIILVLMVIYRKRNLIKTKQVLLFLLATLMIPLPWLIFSFINTGNPIYPFFTTIYEINTQIFILNPMYFIKSMVDLFLFSTDPISPIYLLFIPIFLAIRKRFSKNLNMLMLFSILAIVVWYLTPRSGGGRFIVPYLIPFSILSASTIEFVNSRQLKKLMVAMVLLVAISSILYRGAANFKYFGVILQKESKAEFLSGNLNFGFGDFYDTDNQLSVLIKDDDIVLFYGGHNLFYADFKFIHESYVKKGDKFNFILTQGTNLPSRFSDANLIYQNEKTRIKLYNLNSKIWAY